MGIKMKENLSDEIKLEIEEIKLILNCNMSFCMLKKGSVSEAMKYAKEAIALNDQSSKAYFRLF